MAGLALDQAVLPLTTPRVEAPGDEVGRAGTLEITPAFEDHVGTGFPLHPAHLYPFSAPSCELQRDLLIHSPVR